MSERFEKLQKLAKEEFGITITRQNVFSSLVVLFEFTSDELASMDGSKVPSEEQMLAIEKAELKIDYLRSGSTCNGPFFFDDDVVDWCKALIRNVGVAPKVYQSAGECILLEWKTNYGETIHVEVGNGLRIELLQKDRLDRTVEVQVWKPGANCEAVAKTVKRKLNLG